LATQRGFTDESGNWLNAYNKRLAETAVGDFGDMNCDMKRDYSTRQVEVSDLPIAIALRCDGDQVFAGFDSVNSRTNGIAGDNSMSGDPFPYGFIKCKSSDALGNGIGGVYAQKGLGCDTGSRNTGVHNSCHMGLMANDDELQININADRTIDFQVNGVHQWRSDTSIPENMFPVDFELAANDRAANLRGVHWVELCENSGPLCTGRGAVPADASQPLVNDGFCSAFADSAVGSDTACMAFSTASESRWEVSGTSTEAHPRYSQVGHPHNIGWDFKVPTAVTSYLVDAHGLYGPIRWVVEGSHDLSSWVTVDDSPAVTAVTNGDGDRVFQVPATNRPAVCKQFRIWSLELNRPLDSAQIQRIQFYGASCTVVACRPPEERGCGVLPCPEGAAMVAHPTDGATAVTAVGHGATIDLQQPRAVTFAHVFNAADSPTAVQRVKVEASNDRLRWATHQGATDRGFRGLT
jgi:hypothetical protein